MKSKVRIIKNPTKAIKRIEKIAKSMSGPSTVKVGLPKGSNNYPDGTSVIMVGSVHEFGSPSRGIPQRSFLRSTVTENRRAYKELFKKIAKSITDGKINTKQGLSLIGLQVEADVKQKIVDIKKPANTESTISGKGSSNPLIDTGHLRQSIIHKVEA